MSEPHRVRARIERVPVLSIALGAGALLLAECALAALFASIDAGAMPAGATVLRGVSLSCFLGGAYEGRSFAALLPAAFARGFWAGLLFGLALQGLASLAALRVTISFDEEAP